MRFHPSITRAITLLSTAWLLALSPAAGAAEEMVTLNFVNADIETVAKAVSQITGKNFLLDPRVKGTVNIVSGRPVPQSVVYAFLLSALRMQGFAAVENNGMVRIMPEADAKTHAGPIFSGGKNQTGDQMMTKVFHLRFESASQMVTVLRPLIAPSNTINANPNNNSLVISDYADNLARLEKIIEALDSPYGEEPQLIAVKHASAIELANTLNRLYGDASGTPGDASQRATIVADSRTNGLIVRSDNPGKLARIRSMVASLDQPTASAGNIHVVYLKNADATRVAQTLRSIVTGETAPPASMQPLSTTSTSGTTATQQPAGSAPMNPAQPAYSSTASSSSGGASGSGSGFIQADAHNNALIITAPEAVFNNLRRVIEMLDKRRAQVFVEALIVELTSDRASEFGIQWQEVSKGHALGGTNFGNGGANIIGLIQNAATAKTTGSLGIPPGLNIGLATGPNSRIPNLGVLARALETDANANILSTPNLLTLDNEEAKIVIGSNVPFITGQYAQTGNTATATPFQTYDRKDVGLTLKIRPQISEGGIVRLQIFQEASSIQEGTISNASGPITNKRSIESAVLVDDGGIVVIGGLIEDNFGMGEDKVPLLGDIPVLGNLFRYQTRKRTKTNLMVFLRPTIIRDAAGYQAVTADRYDYILGQQMKVGEGQPWIWREPQPSLPPRMIQAPVPPAAK